jgi:hypothetical protein
MYQPKAQLSSPDPGCIKSKSLFFYMNKNPFTGANVAAPGYAIGGGTTTNPSGQGTMNPGVPSKVGNTSWKTGTYTVTAKFLGSTGCLASQGSSSLSVKK